MFETKLDLYADRVLKTGQRSKNFLYEPFLIDLIDGHMSSKEDILDRIRAINIPFAGKFRLYQICFEKFTTALASYTRSNCKSVFPSARFRYHDTLSCSTGGSERLERRFRDLPDG
jgi:hypothetical protein